MTTQQLIYNYIKAYTENNGCPPTIREISAHVGVVESTVHRHIDKMVERGIMKKGGRGCARTVRVIRKYEGNN